MDKVIIFTDGACSGNPGPGGWGAILVSPLGKVMEIGGSELHTTNNRMELTATIEALNALGRVKKLSTKEVRLYTDSKYIINGITSWVAGWQARGWKTAEGKDVSNRELWEALSLSISSQSFRIEWLYVPGHMGFPGNERCDEIAVAFSKGVRPALYQGASSDYRVDIAHVPKGSSPKAAGGKKGPTFYLSYVDGAFHRDTDWKTCEARVKGRAGAKFKKVQSAEEEEHTRKLWGLS